MELARSILELAGRVLELGGRVFELGPTYISNLIKRHKPTRLGLRLALGISRLAVPATNSRAEHSTAERVFSVCVPHRLWDSLSVAVRGSKSIDSFKRNLKTFLFSKCFC